MQLYEKINFTNQTKNTGCNTLLHKGLKLGDINVHLTHGAYLNIYDYKYKILPITAPLTNNYTALPDEKTSYFSPFYTSNSNFLIEPSVSTPDFSFFKKEKVFKTRLLTHMVLNHDQPVYVSKNNQLYSAHTELKLCTYVNLRPEFFEDLDKAIEHYKIFLQKNEVFLKEEEGQLALKEISKLLINHSQTPELWEYIDTLNNRLL